MFSVQRGVKFVEAYTFGRRNMVFSSMLSDGSVRMEFAGTKKAPTNIEDFELAVQLIGFIRSLAVVPWL